MVEPGSQGQGLQGYSFSLLWAGTFLSKRKKNKNNNNPTCYAQSLVCQSCSRKNVVEPAGKTSLVRDTVFGHDQEEE